MRHDLVNPPKDIVGFGEHLVFILRRQCLQPGLVLRLVIHEICEITLSLGSLEYFYWEKVSIFLEVPLCFIGESRWRSKCHDSCLRRSLLKLGFFGSVSATSTQAGTLRPFLISRIP